MQDINADPDDAAITAAVIAMAGSMNLGVVAEGVETGAQLNIFEEKALWGSARLLLEQASSHQRHGSPLTAAAPPGMGTR